MEPNFKFRLEKVLEIKIKKENEHMISHSKIMNEKITLEKEIESLELQYNTYSEMNYLEEDSFKRKIAYNYMNSLFQTIQIKKDLLEKIEEKYKESLSILVVLQTERKALEELKQKQYKKFLEQLEQEEEALNDEFSTQTYFRNNLQN